MFLEAHFHFFIMSMIVSDSIHQGLDHPTIFQKRFFGNLFFTSGNSFVSQWVSFQQHFSIGLKYAGINMVFSIILKKNQFKFIVSWFMQFLKK